MRFIFYTAMSCVQSLQLRDLSSNDYEILLSLDTDSTRQSHLQARRAELQVEQRSAPCLLPATTVSKFVQAPHRLASGRGNIPPHSTANPEASSYGENAGENFNTINEPFFLPDSLGYALYFGLLSQHVRLERVKEVSTEEKTTKITKNSESTVCRRASLPNESSPPCGRALEINATRKDLEHKDSHRFLAFNSISLGIAGTTSAFTSKVPGASMGKKPNGTEILFSTDQHSGPKPTSSCAFCFPGVSLSPACALGKSHSEELLSSQPFLKLPCGHQIHASCAFREITKCVQPRDSGPVLSSDTNATSPLDIVCPLDRTELLAGWSTMVRECGRRKEWKRQKANTAPNAPEAETSNSRPLLSKCATIVLNKNKSADKRAMVQMRRHEKSHASQARRSSIISKVVLRGFSPEITGKKLGLSTTDAARRQFHPESDETRRTNLRPHSSYSPPHHPLCK
eukprot:GHVT01059713.1.p1 GENE.GHVT01059713.1~~GHVT01059713.1.p1  ORF type:complete len:456 (+),score=13.82 GHVT01059713.1:1459-2826(+)